MCFRTPFFLFALSPSKRDGMRESAYEKSLIKRLLKRYPEAVVLKNDSSYLQGVPDRLILHRDRWAMLEIKQHANSPVQPNQPYYIDLFNSMSFASFISPETEGEVLDALQRSLIDCG